MIDFACGVFLYPKTFRLNEGLGYATIYALRFRHCSRVSFNDGWWDFGFSLTYLAFRAGMSAAPVVGYIAKHYSFVPRGVVPLCIRNWLFVAFIV